jgi:hypothetical protein
MGMDGDIREIMACPQCGKDLDWAERIARCRGCAGAYEVANGVLVVQRSDGLQADVFSRAWSRDASDGIWNATLRRLELLGDVVQGRASLTSEREQL